MAGKHKRTGLTLVEILVVLGIIALLAGLLLPAMTVVKNTAKETKQKAQFSSINLALVTFKNDYGDYPDSSCLLTGNYTGAQKLSEALVGWDLMGFHPDSEFRADGRTAAGEFIYDQTNTLYLDQRKGPYLDRDTANAFKLRDTLYPERGLFDDIGTLSPDTYVLCDVFKMKSVQLPNGAKVNAGAPILYYKANTSQRLITEIYKMRDNDPIVFLKQSDKYLASGAEFFYDYITDPKTLGMTNPQPYRPDSYILISAGLDGLYGTADDIRNFGN